MSIINSLFLSLIFERCKYRFLSRWFSTNSTNYISAENVRVRFAPSPTGELHLGGFRTALLNYLFARSNGGKFIFRIEDTDRTRIVPGSAEKQEGLLRWAGIVPDEGPTVGGPFGPYVQSKRLNTYKHYADKLLENGHAYRCFCSPRRLDLVRREAKRTCTPNRYDGYCSTLSSQEVAENLGSGMAFVIRFKLNNALTNVKFNDLINGPIHYHAVEHEGDPIIVKSDGIPTYHLANVVDDHLMQISHVLRGVEWQVSTPKHILLYAALGWRPPIFGHLPLILNSSGAKLSKRNNEFAHIEIYRLNGHFPEALINFACLMGGGFPNRPHNTAILYSLQDLTDLFNIQKVNSASCRLDPVRLEELGKVALRNRFLQPQDRTGMIDTVRKMFSTSLPFTDEQIERRIRWAIDGGRIVTLKNLKEPKFDFLWSCNRCLMQRPPLEPGDAKILENAAKVFESNFDTSNIVTKLRILSENESIRFSRLMRLLRRVLCGTDSGPPVAEIIDLIGREDIIKQLEWCTHSDKTSQEM